MSDKEKLLKDVEELLKQPGGKGTLRFLLDSCGGPVAASSSAWRDYDNHKILSAFSEWANSVSGELDFIAQKVNIQSSEISKPNLNLLLSEITGYDFGSMEPQVIRFGILLNSQTVGELEKFIKTGWIHMQGTGSTANMGVGNKIGNFLEDKKRPYGMGDGFIITITDDFFIPETAANLEK